jgi:prepilin-type N-terminal cleavage/methylation domain-containing protein
MHALSDLPAIDWTAEAGNGMIARLRSRLAESGGFTLTEMIVVMVILGVVLTALTQLFVSGTKAEADMSNRFQAQQNARLALDGLRREIHCANGVVVPTTISFTLTLPYYCPTNSTVPRVDTSVTWCTVGAGAKYALWRYEGSSCSGTGRKWADNLVTGAVFSPVYATPAVGSGNLGTISVDLPVDLTPSDTKQRYRLQDEIVLRNTPRP